MCIEQTLKSVDREEFSTSLRENTQGKDARNEDFRYPTDSCPPIVVTMCIQFLTGLVLQTLMAGVIFAKLARPIKRAATILFSKNAVICMRDGKLCLLFRVGDMRKSSLAEAHIRLQVSD